MTHFLWYCPEPWQQPMSSAIWGLPLSSVIWGLLLLPLSKGEEKREALRLVEKEYQKGLEPLAVVWKSSFWAFLCHYQQFPPPLSIGGGGCCLHWCEAALREQQCATISSTAPSNPWRSLAPLQACIGTRLLWVLEGVGTVYSVTKSSKGAFSRCCVTLPPFPLF